jgi:hypothetical protein
MKKVASIATFACVLALGVGPGAGATPSGSTPPQSGCPASASLVAVQPLTDAGYGLPAALDGAGNQDGKICAFPLPEAVAKNQTVEIIYQFFENNLPSAA